MNNIKVTLAILIIVCVTLFANYKDPLDGGVWKKGAQTPTDSLLLKLKSLPLDHSSVLETLRKYYVFQPSSQPYNLKAKNNKDYAIAYHKYYWDFVDYYIKQFFANKTKGFFFEAGALDGEFISNTLWLEQEMKWTGILVEPDSFSYKNLLEKHRKSWTSPTCISRLNHYDETVFETLTPFDSAKKYIKFFWIIKAQTRSVNQSNFLKNKNLIDFEKVSSLSFEISHCFPLLSYFLALNVSVVDFISLDTEGGEYSALKHLFSSNKGRLSIRSIAVEHKTEDKGALDQEFLSFMKENQFTLIDSDPTPTYFFIKSSDETLTTLHNSKVFQLMAEEQKTKMLY